MLNNIKNGIKSVLDTIDTIGKVIVELVVKAVKKVTPVPVKEAVANVIEKIPARVRLVVRSIFESFVSTISFAFAVLFAVAYVKGLMASGLSMLIAAMGLIPLVVMFEALLVAVNVFHWKVLLSTFIYSAVMRVVIDPAIDWLAPKVAQFIAWLVCKFTGRKAAKPGVDFREDGEFTVNVTITNKEELREKIERKRRENMAKGLHRRKMA